MTLIGALVGWREAVSSRALRSNPQTVLNPDGGVEPAEDASAVAEALKRSLNSSRP